MADEDQNQQGGEEFDFDAEWERAQAEVQQMNARFNPVRQQQQTPPPDDDEDEDDEPPAKPAVDQSDLDAIKQMGAEARQFITRREEARAIDRLYETMQEKMSPIEAKHAKDMLEFDGSLDDFKASYKRLQKFAQTQEQAITEARNEARREALAEAAQRGLKPILTPQLQPSKDDKANEALQKLDETKDERYLDEYLERTVDGFMGFRSSLT